MGSTWSYTTDKPGVYEATAAATTTAAAAAAAAAAVAVFITI